MKPIRLLTFGYDGRLHLYCRNKKTERVRLALNKRLETLKLPCEVRNIGDVWWVYVFGELFSFKEGCVFFLWKFRRINIRYKKRS